MGNSINTDKYVGIGLRGIIAPSIDASAAAFFAASGITGATQQAAIDNLVKGLKSDGLWSKMKAVYPFVTDNRNLLSYTEVFNNGVWSVTGSGITANTTTAPNGTLTADTIKEDATTGQHRIFQFFNATAGTAYTASIFCKAGVGTRNITVLFGCGFGADNRVTFNVNNGTIVASFGASGTITDVGNGWYRCTASAAASATVSSCLQYQLRDGTTEIYAGDNTSSLIIWGAQVEQSATPSAYQTIATTQQAYIASQFKYNLKDPRDLDAAFRLVFNGGWTHSSTGATPNGTNGYADTKFVPSANGITTSNAHISFYSRNTNVNGLFPVDMGVDQSSTQSFNVSQKMSDVSSLSYHGRAFTQLLTGVDTNNIAGLHTVTRTSTTSLKYNRNGNIIQTNSVLETGTVPTLSVFISSTNNNGTASLFSTRQAAFSTIGDGLTDTEAANLYTRVQAFQNQLFRAV